MSFRLTCIVVLCSALGFGQAKSNIRFTDITQQAGLRFVHNNGAFCKKYLPETL